MVAPMPLAQSCGTCLPWRVKGQGSPSGRTEVALGKGLCSSKVYVCLGDREGAASLDPCKEVTPMVTECHVPAIPFWI